MRCFLCGLIFVGMASSAQAITVIDAKKPDPLMAGAECDAPRVGSFGGYVYQYPSRFDLVFDPFVGLLWDCPQSGFVSYPDDFETMTQAEKQKVKDYLAGHPWDATKPKARIERLGDIYELRDLTRSQRADVYRSLAWLWTPEPRADQYRKKALELHKQILAEDNPQGKRRIQTLYIIGFYTWKLGAPKEAEVYFKELRSLRWKDQDGEAQTGDSYIEGLIAEIREGKAEDAVRFK